MRETMKLVALLAIAVGVLFCYALVPERIAGGLHLRQVSLAAIESSEETAAVQAAQAAVKEKEPVDTAAQRILLFGDSMSEPLGLRLADYANRNGHRLTCVTWVSSGTATWANSDTLSHYIRSVRPTHVFVCLGSNELYTVDKKGTEKRIRTILEKIGNIPTVWIGPPNWCEDQGLNKWLLEILGSKRYYPSYELTFERQKDGRHPTQKASSMWMDKIVEWMNAGNSVHPFRMAKPDNSVHPFRMAKPDKKDRRYRQVTILPKGTKHGTNSTTGNEAAGEENQAEPAAGSQTPQEQKGVQPEGAAKTDNAKAEKGKQEKQPKAAGHKEASESRE